MAIPQRLNAPKRMDTPQDRTIFPHTVTLYTTRTEPDKTNFEDVTTNYITILKGVLCDDSKASNVRASGLEGADAVNLYIPFDVEAVDAITGEQKEYIGPVEFWRLDDKEGYWTLTTRQDTWFVKGEAIPDPSWDSGDVRDIINGMYDAVYNVTKIDIKDFGGLQHFEIGGA